MKNFIVVAVLLGVIAGAMCLSDEMKEKIKKHKTECIAETGATEEELEEAKKEQKIDEDSKVPEFLVCFFKKIEFLDAEGEIDEEVLKTKLANKFTEDEAASIAEECSKDKHEPGKESAIHLAKCLHKHAPKEDEH